MVSQCFILLQADKVIVIFSGASFFNGNWTEWSAIWAEIICMTSKLNECTAQVQFEITSIRFWTKIAQHEVQLPLYYIHFEIAQIQDLVSSNILLMQYWASLKLNSSIFWREKVRVLETKVAKFATWYSLSFIFSAIWSAIWSVKQALKSDWLFCFWCSLLIGWEKDAI